MARIRWASGCYSVFAMLVLAGAIVVSIAVVWPATIDILARGRCEGPIRRVGKSVTCIERGTGRRITLGDLQFVACCPGTAIIFLVLVAAMTGAWLVRRNEERIV